MYQVGDKARVRRDTNYFTQKYEDTIVEVVRTFGENVYEVRTFDNEVFMAHDEYLIPLDYWQWKKDQEPQSKKCKHGNKYYNVLSRTLRFWYCPDCQCEVKDD
jgi:hypothetical protein